MICKLNLPSLPLYIYNKQDNYMELKTWLIIVRILNCLSSLMLISFQIWFLVDLFSSNSKTVYGIMICIWAPIFVM